MAVGIRQNGKKSIGQSNDTGINEDAHPDELIISSQEEIEVSKLCLASTCPESLQITGLSLIYEEPFIPWLGMNEHDHSQNDVIRLAPRYSSLL